MKNNWNILNQIIQNYQYSQIIQTAVELEIFKILEKDYMNIQEISKKLVVSERSVKSLLLLLEKMKLLKSRGNTQNEYKATKISIENFGSDGKWIHWTLHQKTLYSIWGNLSDSIKNNSPFLQSSHDFNIEHYVLGLRELYISYSKKIHDIINLQGKLKILDVGGGAGHFTSTAIEHNPAIEGTIIEKKEIIEIVKKKITPSYTKNINYIEGDALVIDWPTSYDVVLLSNILHGKSDKECMQLITKAHHSLKPGGRIVINDLTEFQNIETALFDLTMLLCTSNGRIRNKKEIGDMVSLVGFREKNWKRLSKTNWILEAWK